MPLRIQTRFAFALARPGDVLLQFEAADIPEQRIVSAGTVLPDALHRAPVAAQDDIGRRIWLRAEGVCEVTYDAVVAPQRHSPPLSRMEALSPHDLPGEAVQYLFDSRYCPGDRFQAFVESEFAGTAGGSRVEAIREWIAERFEYVAGVSGPQTNAVDSFLERRGICRDYAHTLIAMVRASAIPARYVACYAPGVDPPDFHAIAEVFLRDPEHPDGGFWRMVDATGMADPARTAKIGVGRDAADVSFLTSFGPSEFRSSAVKAFWEDEALHVAGE